MEPEREDKGAACHPPAAEVEAAFAALPAEVRAAVWFSLVEGTEICEVAETLRMTPRGAAFLVEKGKADIAERLRGRGWAAVCADGLGAFLLELPPPEAPAGLCKRILERSKRYFS